MLKNKNSLKFSFLFICTLFLGIGTNKAMQDVKPEEKCSWKQNEANSKFQGAYWGKITAPITTKDKLLEKINHSFKTNKLTGDKYVTCADIQDIYCLVTDKDYFDESNEDLSLREQLQSIATKFELEISESEKLTPLRTLESFSEQLKNERLYQTSSSPNVLVENFQPKTEEEPKSNNTPKELGINIKEHDEKHHVLLKVMIARREHEDMNKWRQQSGYSLQNYNNNSELEIKWRNLLSNNSVKTYHTDKVQRSNKKVVVLKK